jgi:dihydroorotate dehydrogenase
MLRKLCYIASAGILCTGYLARNPDSNMHKYITMPILHSMDPETAHKVTVLLAHYARPLMPKKQNDSHMGINRDALRVTTLGLEFNSPIGVAAGFDKDARCMGTIHDMGFGFIEIGTVVPEPQPGNPKPRVFRLFSSPDQPKFDTIINRYGFNSEGITQVAKRLQEYRSRGGVPKNTFPIGINIGKNKNTVDEDSINREYELGIERLSKYADYMVINISSPNTPNLLTLQQREPLQKLLTSVTRAINEWNAAQNRYIPLLIKISPDITDAQKVDIADLALEYNIDGIIVSNTTISREGVSDPKAFETGGLSGRTLKNLSTQVLRDMYALTQGKLVLIGVGGIFSGADVLDKVEAGASLVQVYTALTSEGPPLLGRLERELSTELNQRGYKNIQEAVGKKVKLIEY